MVDRFFTGIGGAIENNFVFPDRETPVVDEGLSELAASMTLDEMDAYYAQPVPELTKPFPMEGLPQDSLPLTLPEELL